MDYTDEQKSAIFTRGCDLLVAAAAGSGKTAVLVERIIQIITNVEKPVDIDRLLVVTFTEAAASEMRQRISKAITEKIALNPSDEHLRKQFLMMSKSSITTIHSFCLNVVRRNFHLLDIDPNFRVSDETETGLLKSEALDGLFEELYEAPDADDFLQLVECYGGKVKDENLQKLVLQIYEFVMSSPDPEKWLHDYTEVFKLESGINDTYWAKLVMEDVHLKLNGISDELERLMEKIATWDIPAEVFDMLNDDLNIVKFLLSSKEFTDMYARFQSVSHITFPRKKFNEEHKEYIQKFRNKRVKEVISGINKNVLFKSPEDMVYELRAMYTPIKTLGRIVSDFKEKYREVKKDKNLVDFNDLEHYALKTLIDINTFEATEEAFALRQKFEEVLIDEYQDSNMIQEIILSTVSRKSLGAPNRFMVGDVKQSIYRFRLANPDLFREKYSIFKQVQQEGDAEGRRIDLSKNFRSRSNILDGINFLFRQLMTEAVGEIDYDDKAALYYGASYEAFKNPKDAEIELHLINCESKDDETEEEENEIEDIGKLELEAKIVAERINGIVGNMEIGGRKVEYGDIVILVRSIMSVSETYINELKNQNIPAFANTSGGYFETIEVATVLSFLHIIDNPRQDIHLLSALHSPVYGITADEFIRIRNVMPSGTFFDCITKFTNEPGNGELHEKITKFLTDLYKWRDMAVYTPVSELLWTLYEETDYYNYVGAYNGGRIRQANLDALVQRAIRYEKTSFKGLYHFIRYIERLQKNGSREGDAQITSENENQVRLMTIHKSKGLEFPVVFVCGLGKRFNMQDTAQKLILHQKYGFGPKYIDPENRIQSNTLARYALACEIRKENLSEELRVLYVALTRAKEKLILTGAGNISEGYEKWREFADYKKSFLPPYYMLKSKTYLDWIVPVVLRQDDKKLFKIIDKVKSDIQQNTQQAAIETASRYSGLTEVKNKKNHSGRLDEIEKNLNWVYKHRISWEIPSKVSISEIKRLYYKETIGECEMLERKAAPIFETPKFITGVTGSFTAAQLGTITHTVIEHLDFNNHDIDALLAALVKKNILTSQEAEVVNKGRILKFLDSPIAERIRQSGFVKREIPFVIGVKPSEIYLGDNADYETILVNGIIDCVFEENGSLVLVDFKTDAGSPEEIAERYKIQIEIYKKAAERSYGKAVKESVLYLFGSGGTEVILL